jgi:putative Mn2+ efflux pump MntP
MKIRPSRVTDRIHNLTIAIISIQAGCASLVIIFIALIIGAWLGDLLGQRGLCIFGMVILSVPVSLYVMLWIAMRAVNFHLHFRSIDTDTAD